MQDIIRYMVSFVQFIINKKTSVHEFNMEVLFLRVVRYKCDEKMFQM